MNGPTIIRILVIDDHPVLREGIAAMLEQEVDMEIVGTADDGAEKYHELRCDVCGGNGSYGSGKLLEGVKGFKAHFRQIHHEQLLTADVLSRCSYREVPLQEVQEIQAGNVNIGFIRCEGSENVRPKKSYKDFNNVERT